jgi:hypothetical protein
MFRFFITLKFYVKRGQANNYDPYWSQTFHLACFTLILNARVQMFHNVRFEVFTAVTMKNVVFWDKNSSSYLTRNILLLRSRTQPVNAM